jgi:cobalamin biosynthesis Mg chelatase CobN
VAVIREETKAAALEVVELLTERGVIEAPTETRAEKRQRELAALLATAMDRTATTRERLKAAEAVLKRTKKKPKQETELVLVSAAGWFVQPGPPNRENAEQD